MKTIYSIRTALGREITWSTSRSKMLARVAEVNADEPAALVAHEFPLQVWKCTPAEARASDAPAVLSERRAADRERMALELTAALAKLGVTIARDHEWPAPRGIMLRIGTEHGATIAVNFDGDSTQPDVFVQTWNLTRPAFEAGRRFRDDEGRVTHKWNRVARGFPQLVRLLTTDVQSFNRGDGFVEPGEVREFVHATISRRKP